MTNSTKRTGKARIEGVDYTQRKDGETGSLSKTGARAKRKPTLAELEANWEACERSWEASAVAAIRAGKPMLWTKFKLRHQEALLAEIESRKAQNAPARKPRTARPSVPKRRKRVGIDCGEPRTERQISAIAAQALALLGESLPSTRDEANDLLSRLAAVTN